MLWFYIDHKYWGSVSEETAAPAGTVFIIKCDFQRWAQATWKRRRPAICSRLCSACSVSCLCREICRFCDGNTCQTVMMIQTHIICTGIASLFKCPVVFMKPSRHVHIWVKSGIKSHRESNVQFCLCTKAHTQENKLHWLNEQSRHAVAHT